MAKIYVVVKTVGHWAEELEHIVAYAFICKKTAEECVARNEAKQSRAEAILQEAEAYAYKLKPLPRHYRRSDGLVLEHKQIRDARIMDHYGKELEEMGIADAKALIQIDTDSTDWEIQETELT